jgi:glutathione S-transferase
MKFYCAPGTISIATAILLEETGQSYEPVMLDFTKAEQSGPAYQAVNPKGRVPAIVTDMGILTETGAIFEYLATRAPDLNLVPADPWAAAQMRSVMYYLASTMHVNHAHKYRGGRWANDKTSIADMRAKVPETMAASCAFLESQCALDPFVMGKEMTLADPWLFTICTWLEGDGVEIAEYPRLAAFYEIMQTRPSIAAVRALGLLS